LQLTERRNFIRDSRSWRLQLLMCLRKFLRSVSRKRYCQRKKYFWRKNCIFFLV